MSSKTFIEQWTRDIGVEFKYVEEPEQLETPLCPYAVEFAAWCETLLAETNPTDDISINTNLLALQDAYWSWFELAPKKHRYHYLDPRNGKKCLFVVYYQTFVKLRKLAIAITKPRLKPPKPPQPSMTDQFLGLGEDLGPAFNVDE